LYIILVSFVRDDIGILSLNHVASGENRNSI